jgi:hypothetical protein
VLVYKQTLNIQAQELFMPFLLQMNLTNIPKFYNITIVYRILKLMEILLPKDVGKIVLFIVGQKTEINQE